ncbi:MAG: antibiotic biosynthesis monooxygenase [Azoarcus sp.]|jgi:quinol monooxygenase YgiN|nr:antibiotic biosynthesis monooxygenase [Azoarcus sp.]
MIKVVAQFYIKNQEIEKALTLVKELVFQTKKETGCVNINYELFQKQKSPVYIEVSEKWENQTVLDAHTQTHHFTDLVPKLQALTDRDRRTISWCR